MPSMAWYFDLCRAGITSPMIADTREFSPPPPTPCRPRNSASHSMLAAAPHSAEPARNTAIENWKTGLRPYMSPSLPSTSVVTALVSR